MNPGAHLLDAAPLLGVAAAVGLAMWTARRDARHRESAQRMALHALAHDLTALGTYLCKIRRGTGTPFTVVRLTSLPTASQALGALEPAGEQAVFEVRQRIVGYNAVTGSRRRRPNHGLDSTVEAIDDAPKALVTPDVVIGTKS